MRKGRGRENEVGRRAGMCLACHGRLRYRSYDIKIFCKVHSSTGEAFISLTSIRLYFTSLLNSSHIYYTIMVISMHVKLLFAISKSSVAACTEKSVANREGYYHTVGNSGRPIRHQILNSPSMNNSW